MPPIPHLHPHDMTGSSRPPFRVGRGPRARIRSRWIVLLWLAVLTGCVHRVPPVSSVRVSGRELAILARATSAPDEAARAQAGATLLVTSLETVQPGVAVRDLEALLARDEGERCLLEPDWTVECLSRVYSGPWLEVAPEGRRLGLTLHPGKGAPEQVLDSVDPEAPAERLGNTLRAMLELPLSPPPRDPQDAPVPQTGVCLEAQAAVAFGGGVRGLLLAGSAPEQEADALRGEAEHRLEEAHRLSPTLLAAAWLARARLEAGRSADALQLLPEALPERCGLAVALEVRGRARLAAGSVTEGVADLARSARLRPFNDHILGEWADGLIQQERWADAGQVLRRALALSPERLEWRRRLAEVLASSDRLPEAHAVLLEGLEHAGSPGDRALLELDLGRLAEQEEAWTRGVAHYRRGLEHLGDSPDGELRSALLNGLGVALAGAGNGVEAEQALEEAVALRRAGYQPGDPGRDRQLANSLYNLGVVEARAERWTSVLRSMGEAAALYQGAERIATWLDLARLLQQGGEAKTALEVLERVRRAEPKLEPAAEAEWTYLHGLALADDGQTGAALTELGQAAERYAALGDALNEGLAWFNRGTVATRNGQAGVARGAFQKARAAAVRLGDRESIDDIDARLQRLETEEGSSP